MYSSLLATGLVIKVTVFSKLLIQKLSGPDLERVFAGGGGPTGPPGRPQQLPHVPPPPGSGTGYGKIFDHNNK